MPIPTNAAWAARVEQRRRQTYQYFAHQRGVPANVYRAAIENRVSGWIAGAEVRIRLRTDVLERVLDEGRLKNQFETMTSGGALNPVGRIATELSLFGILANRGARDRPIYGYLSGSLEASLLQYGKVVLELSEDIQERTTFTIGDSLDHTRHGTEPWLAPMPVLQPRLGAAHTEIDISACAGCSQASPCGYAEAQIHGGVTLGDIARIVFTGGAAPDLALSQRLAALGLEFVTRQGDEP